MFRRLEVAVGSLSVYIDDLCLCNLNNILCPHPLVNHDLRYAVMTQSSIIKVY
jgi:hypothetical protein